MSTNESLRTKVARLVIDPNQGPVFKLNALTALVNEALMAEPVVSARHHNRNLDTLRRAERRLGHQINN